MRVWVPFESEAEARDKLGELPDNIELDFYTGGDFPSTADEVEVYVHPYLGAHDPWERFGELPKLKVVLIQSAGYEDIQPHIPEGVTLCNAAGVHDASTAEMAVGLSLALGRHLDAYARNQTSGTWEPQFGRSLADQRVTILGYGHIGQAIERRLTGFEVASITRIARRARTEPMPVRPITDLDDVLPETDVLFLITPLTPDTEKIIDKHALALLPDGAQVINVGRGRLIDTDALVAETSSGRLTAGLDVTEPEPLPSDHPLWTSPGVLISPHTGGASSAFFPRSNALIAAQLRRYATGQPLENVIE
ncbi:dehydrogenase [Microlunatus endophyticus]|uniref:Dehydrogenase n=1 Tax=Microlunatus endophyticus TaxID=1716077 RepID=A0A917S273_9ACTN|nr:2-hydroxyacid dehydrogenase [Microlunatus endophyticus]GGL49972.1 dehydrogenase [Microlunatus endophyticus]